jgi:hypothetical protein
MNRTHNPLIAMNRNERSVYSVFSDRIEAYSVIELTEIHEGPSGHEDNPHQLDPASVWIGTGAIANIQVEGRSIR